MPLIHSISGLRGIAFKDLNYSTIGFYAKVFAIYLNAKKLVVGCDTRKSHSSLLAGVIDGINFINCNVVNLGIAPTPTVAFMVRKLRADGGLMVTASHNPHEWNGLKFISARGEFINETEFREFSERLGYFRLYSYKIIEYLQGFGECQDYEKPLNEQLQKIINYFRLSNLGLKIGVDAVGGTGSEALPKLLEMAGCKVFKINCKFKSRFPRPPEPTPENIGDLCQLVKKKKLDLGFALDPDGDRLSIVDTNGNAIGEEKTLALATDYILSRKKGPVVTNLSTTILMDYITRKYKCRLYRTKVGEVNVVAKMKEVSAVIGGEGNGGVIYPMINYTRDAMTGAGIILKLLSKSKKSISEIVGNYPEYYMIKEKVNLSSREFEKRKDLVQKKFKGKVDLIDGIRIATSRYWLHLRPSNTEPLVRIIAEGRDKKQITRIIKQAKTFLSRGTA